MSQQPELAFHADAGLGYNGPISANLSTRGIDRERTVRRESEPLMATQIQANPRRVSAGREFKVKLGLRLLAVKHQIDARIEVPVTRPFVKPYLGTALVGRQIVGPHAQWLLAHQLPQATRLLPGKGYAPLRHGPIPVVWPKLFPECELAESSAVARIPMIGVTQQES